MPKDSLNAKVEALASVVVMADPHDLQAVNKIIQLLGEIADKAEGDLAEVMKPVAKAAVNLAEEMIIQQGEEAKKSLEILGQAVSALQTALRSGPQAALELVPHELEGDLQVSPELPANADEKIFADFLAHQNSVLEEMESSILAIEKQGSGGKHTSDLKRLLHTLKGEAGMLGLADVEQLCHETETFIEQAPEGNIPDCLLSVKDWLSQRFDSFSKGEQVPEDVDQVLSLLKSKAENQEQTPQKSQQTCTEDSEKKFISLEDCDSNLVQDFITEARGHLDNADIQLLTIENDNEDQEALNAVFRSFHTIKGVAGFLDLKEISELSHVAEDLLDRARKGSLALSGAAIDTIFETVDTLRTLVSQVEQALSSGEPVEIDPALTALMVKLGEVVEGKSYDTAPLPVDPDKKLGEILVESGRVKAEAVTKALSKKDQNEKIGEALVKKGGIAAKEVAGALRAQQAARKAKEGVKVKETVNIDTERLDKLIDAIGELVIAESMVSQDEEVLFSASARVSRNLAHLNKITRVVQELGMSMRMVPIRPTFQKMARLVRDLAKKADKDVEFFTSGEETELDRSVVERIGDPLIHLIRNAVDHGIEDSGEERIKAGKPAKSRVGLSAYHQGGSIFIEVTDDGRGLDREAILVKARERGIIQDGSEMTDREVFNLVFAPGFSTAKKVTDVSGRGVGMDVVKRNIEALRGTIELKSELGKGTTVSLRLPLTLAIIDGMIILVGNERYIVPTLSVVESLRPQKKDLSTVYGRGEMLSVRGSLMPLFRASTIFKVNNKKIDPTEVLAIIVENQGRHVALLVDSLIGQQQVVIKNLGEAMGKVQGISGGAIMADGKVGLILDISEIVKIATTREDISKTSKTGVLLKNKDGQQKGKRCELAAAL